MKNKNRHIGRMRRMAKLFHRNDRTTPFERGGIIVRHDYSFVAPDALTWWDDVGFILNDYRVSVHLVHPRMRYQDLIEDEAHRLTDHLYPGSLFSKTIPIFNKVGRSRKRQAGSQIERMGGDEWFNALMAEEARLYQQADYRIEPSMKTGWGRHSRWIDLCAPVEVRNEDDLRALALLAKRLLKRETTLAKEFPGYCYTQSDWERDRPEPNRVHIHALKGTLGEPDKPVSIGAMNDAIAKRGAGLLNGQIDMAPNFDAPLPDDIQIDFDGARQFPARTPEEQAWLDMAPVGREFGSPDYERLVAEDAPWYEQDDSPLSEETSRKIRELAKPMLQMGKVIRTRALPGLEKLVEQAKQSTEKASAAIDDALSFVAESNRRIEEMQPSVPVGRIKTLGYFGPKYEVGRIIRQLGNIDWMVEITMVESGEKNEYRLSRLLNDPDAG